MHIKENVLKDKSFQFALRNINLYNYLKKDHNEFILSKQIVRSGTLTGAAVREAEHAESIKDFIHKFSICLKEVNETTYWLDLLLSAAFITKEMHEFLNKDCEELLKLLTASVKKSKLKLK
ncbi:four helix bundle protein [soil metagenome]